MTKVLDGTLAKVVAAYDNELGNSRWGGDMVTSRGKWLVEGTVDPHCLRVVLECLLACHYVACDNAREPTMGQRQVVTVPQIRTNEAGPSDPRRATALLNVLIEAIQEHAASITYVFSISRFFRISPGPPTQVSESKVTSSGEFPPGGLAGPPVARGEKIHRRQRAPQVIARLTS